MMTKERIDTLLSIAKRYNIKDYILDEDEDDEDSIEQFIDDMCYTDEFALFDLYNEGFISQEKLEKIAKEMYGIKEFVDVSNENKTIKEKEKKLELLKKKIIVFDSAKEVNKKKYEVEIAKKER